MATPQDIFYDFNRFKKDATDWTQTPAIGGPSGYLEEQQDAAFTRQLAAMGIGLADTTPYANWVKEQFRNTQTGFKAALAEDPLTTYQGYIKDIFGVTGVPKLKQAYSRLGRRARGEYPEQLGGAMRTIADL